jgi:transketolase
MSMSMRESYGRALAEYGRKNARVVVLDADTASSTLTKFFADQFPGRFYNIGIAEPCMTDIGVGLSLVGKIPFVNAFAALVSLRALEQVRTCVAYAQTNVKIVGNYCGLSDFKDGPTHHAITDLTVMRAMPGMTVIAPADAAEAAVWVPIIAEFEGPVYLRISRDATIDVHDLDVHLEIGKGLVLKRGKDVSIFCTGSMVGRSLLAARQLEDQGVSAQVIEIHTLKPLDEDLIKQAAADTGAVVTAEEHTIIGGLGSAVAEVLGEQSPTPMKRVGILDTFACTGRDANSLMDAFKLAVDDITKASLTLCSGRGK